MSEALYELMYGSVGARGIKLMYGPAFSELIPSLFLFLFAMNASCEKAPCLSCVFCFLGYTYFVFYIELHMHIFSYDTHVHCAFSCFAKT